MTIAQAKELAAKSHDLTTIAECHIRKALLIRCVEEKLMDLFAQGKMNGTIHSCVGQEFSPVALAAYLSRNDVVTSNHRCHGHFIAKTGDWRGLIDELMGFASGVCKGIGSSQHLYAKGFLSNGVQASLLAVGTGIALDLRRTVQDSIVVSFIGEGTLGEGAFYEALNLASVLQVPQLFVCENNFYSQSTLQASVIAGSIEARSRAFGVETFSADTWDLKRLFSIAGKAVSHVRQGKPAFLVIRTYRLHPHSKGDDNRDVAEIEHFRKHDPLNRFLQTNTFQELRTHLVSDIEQHIERTEKQTLHTSDYIGDQLPRLQGTEWKPVLNQSMKMHHALNLAYKQRLSAGAFFVGEDIGDPYGGAFKITKGFSTTSPEQVFSTPISESGIIGLAIGMALQGTEIFAEVMFGDFMTLTFDQVLNNASKMHHMYAKQVNVPLRIRSPMGGKRGYGPTHSQSLEKHFVGIDNVAVVYLTSLENPESTVAETSDYQCPFLIFENKLDYARLLWQQTALFKLDKLATPFGALLLSPASGNPTITIVSYGETARHIADSLETFFEETDEIPELITVILLHPLDLTAITQSLQRTNKLIIVEDGSVPFGLGAEILSRVVELRISLTLALRVGADPYPIASVRSVENDLLPSIAKVIHAFYIAKEHANSRS